ncbi:MAG: GDYXXLXY domain-containing protein [Hyphomicrobiaceae bacterium]|nr:GDYXXLXY domain-containing protein [Hyphomicrobiaceae bacterium]
MRLPRPGPALALAIVAGLQTAVLLYMVIDRSVLLKTGREIVLPVRPVDPRDLFRGQYVRLGFDVASVPLKLVEGPRPTGNKPFYVTIEQQEGGDWTPVRITAAPPGEAGPKQIVLKARPYYRFPPATASPNGMVQARYGIESYFVTEGEGPRLEALARDKKVAVLVAVDGRGNAALKGILIDGKLQYTEPLL